MLIRSYFLKQNIDQPGVTGRREVVSSPLAGQVWAKIRLHIRADNAGTDKGLNQRIGKPIFILLSGPSALPYQEAVQIAARERPQDVACVLRIESRAKGAGTDEKLDHAGLRVVAGTFALGLRPGERGRNRSRPAEQVENGVLRFVDAPGDTRGEA